MQAFADENLHQGPAALPRVDSPGERAAQGSGPADRRPLGRRHRAAEKHHASAYRPLPGDWTGVAGDNLVLPRVEFPSNRLPWLAQAARGVEVREVDIRAPRTRKRPCCRRMDSRTRLAVGQRRAVVRWFPAGSAAPGRCLPRSGGVLFFVDAIQQLGALPIDVEACRIDFLAADAHKWLLGPEGIALFYSGAAGPCPVDAAAAGLAHVR